MFNKSKARKAPGRYKPFDRCRKQKRYKAMENILEKIKKRAYEICIEIYDRGIDVLDTATEGYFLKEKESLYHVVVEGYTSYKSIRDDDISFEIKGLHIDWLEDEEGEEYNNESLPTAIKNLNKELNKIEFINN